MIHWKKRPSISSDVFSHKGYNISLIVLFSYDNIMRNNNN